MTQTFVKQKIPQQNLVAGLGTDYLSASVWLGSLEKIVPVMDAFKEKYTKPVEEFATVLTGACDLSATILAYNVLVHQFPTKITGRPSAVLERPQKEAEE